jgi:hypothetical protein
MIKKDYQKPTVKVVQLRQHHHILAGSKEPQTLSGSQGDTQEEDTWYELQ